MTRNELLNLSSLDHSLIAFMVASEHYDVGRMVQMYIEAKKEVEKYIVMMLEGKDE